MMRLKSSGFAGPIVGGESGTTDCAAAPPAKAGDSSAAKKNTRLSIIESGERAASVYLDWIRPGIQLLYTAFAPKGSIGYQSVNSRSSPRAAWGFGFLGRIFAAAARIPGLEGGPTPFTRAQAVASASRLLGEGRLGV